MTRLRFPGVKPTPEEIEYEAWLRGPEGHMGHPTAPGPRDPKRRRMGRLSPGNGAPGVPRYTSLATHHPGIPGSTSGPKQPGVIYDNPEGEDRG